MNTIGTMLKPLRTALEAVEALGLADDEYTVGLRAAIAAGEAELRREPVAKRMSELTAERDAAKERFDILWLRHEAGNNEYIRQRALLVRARNLLSQPAHWGADDEHIKSRYALYTEIQEHITGEITSS